MYEKIFHAGWGDMDFNSHMRNTAYLDKSADVRMLFFKENGFPMEEFSRLRIGPVIMRDELEYFREILLLDEIRCGLFLAGLSEDCSRFTMRNEFRLPAGDLAARVTSAGGWLDLATRKLASPPGELSSVLAILPKTADFTILPSSMKSA